MDLLWRSLNGLKCSDHFDECSRMVMLNTRLSIHAEKEPCIQAKQKKHSVIYSRNTDLYGAWDYGR